MAGAQNRFIPEPTADPVLPQLGRRAGIGADDLDRTVRRRAFDKVIDGLDGLD